jgi:chromosome segregation ATPase
MDCPGCKSRNLVFKSSFTTQAEPVGESASAAVVVEMLTCSGCQLEFPSIRGGRMYALVTSTSFESLLKLRAELEQEGTAATEELNELDRKRDELEEEIERFKVEREIDLLRARIGLAESGVTRLTEKRAKLNEVLEAMVARGGRTLRNA